MLSIVACGSSSHPPVLFLHGFMGSAADWDEVIAGLRHDYYCLAVDLPGHGASVGLDDPYAYTMEGAAQGLVGMLDAAGVERCAVVGYSMGGRLALYVALHHPERCRKLLLESASPGLPAEDERAARRGMDEARALRLEIGDFEEFLHEWYGQALFSSMKQHSGLVQRLVAARRRNDPRALARSLRGMGPGRQPSLWERLDDLRVPTWAVAGALDGKYVEVAGRMAVLSPKVKAVVVPNAGHTIHAEQPRSFLDLLLSFLKQPA